LSLYFGAKQINNSLIIRLAGELDFEASVKLRKELEEYLFAHQPRTLVFNLKRLTLLDSSGLGVILLTAKGVKQKNGTIVLITNPIVEKMLELTGVINIFKFAQTEREAIALT
jgi:stage II sporulation protein AA (anti-sigma F factor antagonist)